IQPAVRPRAGETAAAARQLLRFALPYTASMLVGTGVQMALPVLIVNTIGQTPEESASYVGFYRAATVISVSYLGFLLSVLGQDYYPRVSAVSDQPAVLAKLVNEQHRLVLLLAGPMILLVLALTPILVPLIYSREFLPSVDILEWYLIGDLLRFTSWTIGFVVLARSSSIKLFLIELLLGINTLVASWLGMRFLGLPGLGVGFLFTYIVHYLVVWRIVKRDIGLVLTKENLWLLGMCLAGAALIRALPMVGMEAVRTPVALVLAGVGGLAAAQLLWREMGGVQMLRAWLGRAV
ncbi:MAG: oligosaccharide flippase family protein, partial [Chloroflexota bacterium]